MIKSQKNLLLSFVSYLLLSIFLYLPYQRYSMAFFSIVGIAFGALSYKKGESKFGAVSLVSVGVIVLVYSALMLFLDSACGTGGDC